MEKENIKSTGVFQKPNADSIVSTFALPEIENDVYRCRYALSAFSHVGLVLVYFMRVNVSVAVVIMSSAPHLHTTSEPFVPEFHWTSTTVGLILGSFFWGYLPAQMPGAMWAAAVGGKMAFGLSVLTTALISLVTPLLARAAVEYFIASRVVMGLVQGASYPAVHELLAHWLAPEERSSLGTIAFSGAESGAFLALLISGHIGESRCLGGWPSLFILPGILGVLWSLVWSVVIYDTPETHRFISRSERIAILSNSASIAKRTDTWNILQIPLRAMCATPSFWALLASYTAVNCGYFLAMLEIPIYFRTELNVDLGTDGFLASLPFLASFLVAIIVSITSKELLHKQLLGLTQARKLFTTLGMFSSAVLLFFVPIADSRPPLAIGLFTGSVGMLAATLAGVCVNHIDLAPNFAGFLMAFTNTLGTIPGIAIPAVTQRLVGLGPNPFGWRVVIWGTSFILVAGNIIFLFLGSAEEQTWNNTGDTVQAIHLQQYSSLQMLPSTSTNKASKQ